MNKVYIADITTIIPKQYSPMHLADIIYSQDRASRRLNKLAKRMAGAIGIHSRSTVLDLNAYPEKKLLTDQYHSLSWGSRIIDEFMDDIAIQDIGYFNTSYNISSHIDIVPNLACRIAMEKKLDLEVMPEEFVCYGCASGILSLKAAFEYCQKHQRAAVSYIFEHSLWLSNPIYDQEDENFKANFKANLIFSDGAVGILILPECLLSKSQKYLEIIDVDTEFYLGDAVNMEKGKFLVGSNIKDVMPELVSRKSIIPVMQRNDLLPQQIDEWSIHQGGLSVLNEFSNPDILGLSEAQLSMSRESFNAYGNFSTPSCFFVLKNHFENNNADTYGAIVSFGAGYYFGTILYRRWPGVNGREAMH